MSRRISLLWLGLWFGFAILVGWNIQSHELTRAFRAPDLAHPLGFDAFGRDLLFTLARASITSALFALIAVAATCVTGVFLGSLISLLTPAAKYWSLRALETFLAFPFLILALSFAALWGPGWDTLLLSLVIGMAPSYTRLIYARCQELLREPYIEAARSVGASRFGIMRLHFMPALLSITSVKFPNMFAEALLAEATLSFLGVGAPLGRDTWGSLLAQGRDYLIESPHIAGATGLPLVLTVLSLQIVSETLAENPRSGSL